MITLLSILLAVLETFVVGHVRSASTGEPIANANLAIRGTQIGTASGEDGSFYLHLSMGEKGRLRVSALGYTPVTLDLKPGEHLMGDIILVEQVSALRDVFVVPGANPALPILDSIRAHRPSQAQREHVEVIADEHLSPFLTQRHLDFYSPTMPFGTLSFLSPLARSGTNFYHYFLVDSTLTDSTTLYHIDYRPINTVDPLLRGQLIVDAHTWHLTRVTASVPYRANINYLRRMDYTAEYDHGILASDTMDTEWQLSAWRDTVHTTPRWLMNTAQWFAYPIHTGYLDLGTWLELGSLDQLLRYSSYEGLHLGLPFRTNARLMPHVSLGGYVAYGFRDRGIKYRASLTAILPTPRRHLLLAAISDDYRYTEDNDFTRLTAENSPFDRPAATFILEDMAGVDRNPTTTARRFRQLEFSWQGDWCSSHGARPALETDLRLHLQQVGQTIPTRDYRYSDQTYIRHAAVSSVFRLSWGEQTFDIYTQRKHLYGRYPTLFLGAQVGSWSTDEISSRMYARLHLTLMQTLSLGVGGNLDYVFSGGLTTGSVPLELSEQIRGNYGWTYDPTRFSLLRQGTHFTSRWMAVHLHWNGGGILFNRIPYIRYAHLREIVEFKFAYADCLRTPYLEAGIGIGNILGIGECLFVARLTRYTQEPVSNTTSPIPYTITPADTPWLGFRFRLHTSL